MVSTGCLYSQAGPGGEGGLRALLSLSVSITHDELGPEVSQAQPGMGDNPRAFNWADGTKMPVGPHWDKAECPGLCVLILCP